MKKRILGRTGLEVSELGLGGAFATRGDGGYAGAKQIVIEALDLGLNLVDTSADYGDSEAGLGEAMDGLEKPFILCTKLGPRAGSSDFDAQDKAHLRWVVEESLRLLHRETIDILMIHEPDRPGQLDWWTDLKTFDGPVVELLKELKDEGIIRFTGLGGTTAYEIVPIIATGFYDVVLTAFNYSMFWREAQIELIPEAKRQNMGIFLASPTQQGWLASRFDDRIADGRWLNKPRREQLKRLYALVDEVGIPIAEMSLRWALMQPDISTVLTGPRDLDQLRQNVRAAEDGPLPADMMDRIDEIAAMVPFRPYEEPFGCPFLQEDFIERKRPGRAGR
ncbi:MAG: dTDP-4-keto-L-6-deoxy-hexose 2,3-reductase [Gemmatimonadetes bacterium]|nr:dTDP-4-keto-L-6-deoxy-hexose 2,3-reductase [Gemmatimonadota bacterium]|tara:strand:+ start:291 stop:1295 length:1005 start_codon:yes stop_codon:yes gene_type:complete